MKSLFVSLFVWITFFSAICLHAEDVAVLIVIGQSNADGTATPDQVEDARLKAWYDAPNNSSVKDLKIWHCGTRSSHGDPVTALLDKNPKSGFMQLYYKNENDKERTTMIISQEAGSWSKASTEKRAMEAEFGMHFKKLFPDSKLYIMKLGIGGSMIKSWVKEDGRNWDYFKDNIFFPAMKQLVAEGKTPRLMGIWWMQGERDMALKMSASYESKLSEFIERCRTEIGFKNAPFYIGEISKKSIRYDPIIRKAQESVAVQSPKMTFVIDTDDLSFIPDKVHFSSKALNTIANRLILHMSKNQGKWVIFDSACLKTQKK